MFSSEFCKILKNAFSTEHLRTKASVIPNVGQKLVENFHSFFS